MPSTWGFMAMSNTWNAKFAPLAAVVGALTLAGCASTPAPSATVNVPPQWAVGGVGTLSAAPLPAWESFVVSPVLRALVERALDNNRDLRVAVLQMEQAQAVVQNRRAALWPSVGVGVLGNRQTTGENEPIRSTYSAGLQVSGWELDFFGRLSSLSAAAKAQYLASQEARKSSQMSLVAGVVSGWMGWQTSQALVQLSEQTLQSREASLRLTRLRFEAGTASALELHQAESLVAAARATLAQQDRQRALDRHALNLLVGQPLERPLTDQELGAGMPFEVWSQAVADVPVGVPSDVLLGRPDVRAAEQQLQAAQAQVDAARAALFPRITLTASMGSASSALSGLFKSGAWGWSVAPQALLTLWDAGANQANLAASRAAGQIALAQYEKAIQVAFKEVNDALAGQASLHAQRQAQQDLVQAESQRVRLSELRMNQGVASLLEVLDAQRSHFAAQQAVLQVHQAWLQNRVALYKALGGGWSEPSAQAQVSGKL